MINNNRTNHLGKIDQTQNVGQFFAKTTSNKINDTIKSVLFQKKDSQSIINSILSENNQLHHISINKKIMMTLPSQQKVDILVTLLKNNPDISSIDYISQLNNYELCLFITQLPYQNDLQNACIIKDVLNQAIYNPGISMKNKNTFIQLLQGKFIDLGTLTVFSSLLTLKEKIELIETLAGITHCLQFNNYKKIYGDAELYERYDLMMAIVSKMATVNNFDIIMLPYNFAIQDPKLLNNFFCAALKNNNTISGNQNDLINVLIELYNNNNTKRMIETISYEVLPQNLSASLLLPYLNRAKKQSETYESIEYDFNYEKKKIVLTERNFLIHQLYKKIIGEKDLQEKLKRSCHEQISQEMPLEVINTICTQSEIKVYNQKYPNLFAIFSLPIIPDWKIGRDLKNSNLNNNEKNIAAIKYQFARDIKYLQFGSEILGDLHKLQEQEGFQVYKTQNNSEIILTNQNEELKTLLNPINRKKKVQIKDRIFEITIGDKQYILKEQKSSKHLDTLQGGHRTGVSSKEEMSIAKHLNEKHTLIDKERFISLHREKPIGSVTFQDGFQWSLFEKGYGLSTYSDEKLIKSIIQHKEQFLSEYNDVSKQLNITINFEQYAKIKADYMFRSLTFEKEKQLNLAGFKATDRNQGDYRIVTIQNMLFLDFFGYDFEYTQKASIKDTLRMQKKEEIGNDVAQGLYQFNKQGDFIHSLKGTIIDFEIFRDFSGRHNQFEKEIFLAIHKICNKSNLGTII